MTGESLDIQQDQLKKLKLLFPEAITEEKIDWERLQATLGKENIEFRNERYVLNWAGKSEAFKVLQQSTTATLKPAHEESINFDTTENVFIEGENLEVLKVLQKAYYGKIKCIIIDPPYNTGSDSFIYPDSFKEGKEDYQKRIGEKDEEGYLMKEGFFRKNSKDSGHYHSNWLSMMYPRLFLAKNLLSEDGVIFVHIDDNEVHNLRLVMNEIFGEENFVAQIVWQKKTGAGAKTKGFITLHEYVLCYAKYFAQDWDIEIPYSDKTRAMYNKKDEHFDKLGPYATWPLDTTSMDERKNLRFPITFNG
ncbi:MAG: site-specific DNA-methyltransferase, partial [Bacteroidota bacterium]